MLGNRCGIWIVGFSLCLAAAVGVADAQAADAEASDRPPIRRLSDATEAEFANYIAWLHVQPMTPSERTAHFAKMSVRRPCEESDDGAGMFDHRKADCVSLVNQAVAAGMANSWETYCRLVTRLCYKDGIIPLAPSEFAIINGRFTGINPATERLRLLNRNHYLISEWNRNNTWCVRDITKELGAGAIKPWIPLHHIVRRKEMFAKRGLDVDVPPEKVIDAFIPREAVPEILGELQAGDIVQVIRGTWTNRYCDHTGIVVVEPAGTLEETVQFIHAGSPSVRQEPLLRFLRRFPFVQGLKFLRIKPEAQTEAVQEAAAMASRMIVPAAAE